MKKISKIAEECKLDYNRIYRTMKANDIIPIDINGFIFINTHQEDLIHYCLYKIGVLEEVILESKMNIPEKKMTLTEFKKINYGTR